jgi:hypothetical protein
VLGVFALAVLSVAFLSGECLDHHRCGQAENVLSQLLSVLWLALVGTTIVAGWRGLLYGCRRTPRADKPHVGV